jgi:hypothetical protein
MIEAIYHILVLRSPNFTSGYNAKHIAIIMCYCYRVTEYVYFAPNKMVVLEVTNKSDISQVLESVEMLMYWLSQVFISYSNRKFGANEFVYSSG